MIVLLLDAYPRSDSLMDQFDFDNAAFEAELRERGFRVAERSRSNYTATWATLARCSTGVSWTTIPVLNPRPNDPAEQYRRVMLALTESPVLKDLRRDGYEIVTVPSPFESAASHRGSDPGPPQLTSFELSLLQHSLVGRDRLHADAGDRLRPASGEAGKHPSPGVGGGQPVVHDTALRFAHVLAPHPPLVYEADGSPSQPVTCFRIARSTASHRRTTGQNFRGRSST